MRCPTLADLPRSPNGRKGWPWTVETPQLPEVQPNGTPWPLISIVTPSYNQANYLEQTLRSVLLQGYPNLEYVVMDGGSTDGSVDIIDRYRPFLARVEIGPDGGQTKAINKGLSEASGAIHGWINSDDGYMPQALTQVAQAMRPNSIVFGNCIHLDGAKAHYVCPPLGMFHLYKYPGLFAQPTVFWHEELSQGLDETLDLAMDYEFWLRIVPQASALIRVNAALAYAHVHDSQKTAGLGNANWTAESNYLCKKYKIDVNARTYGFRPARLRVLGQMALAALRPPADLNLVESWVEARDVLSERPLRRLQQAWRTRTQTRRGIQA